MLLEVYKNTDIKIIINDDINEDEIVLLDDE